LDETADMAGTDPSSLTRGDDAIVVGMDESSANTGDYEAIEQSPLLIHLPRPDYPPIARVAGVEGIVLLHLLIDEDGQVKDVRVLDGPEMLREAAVAAARQGRFKPAQNQNRPVPAWVQVPMRFSLRT
jgi:protein TonB